MLLIMSFVEIRCGLVKISHSMLTKTIQTILVHLSFSTVPSIFDSLWTACLMVAVVAKSKAEIVGISMSVENKNLWNFNNHPHILVVHRMSFSTFSTGGPQRSEKKIITKSV